jgi:hypothetical protein
MQISLLCSLSAQRLASLGEKLRAEGMNSINKKRLQEYLTNLVQEWF